MQVPIEEILKEAKARERLAADILIRLIREDTTNPPGNECSAGRVVEEFFRSRGIPYENHEKKVGRVNLIGRIGSGARPRLFVPCHLDVVPAGAGWTVDPFGGVEKDGFIYGRGAVDDKGPLAGTLAACDYLKTIEDRLQGTLLVGAVSDEECGSVYGLDYLMKEKLVEADAAYVPDVHSYMKSVEVAEKGLVDIEVVFTGKQAHASTPELGASAAMALADLMVRTEPWTPAGALPHALLSKPTACVGIVQSGIAPNVVPGSARAIYNFRYLPGQDAEGIRSELARAAELVASQRPGVTASVKVLHDLPPIATDPERPEVQALVQAIADVTGRRPSLIGIGGTTVCKQLVWAGITAVGFGPGDGGLCHMADERIEIEELVRYAGVVVAAALRVLGA